MPVAMRAITCPGCGGSVQLRGFDNTLTVVCEHCASVLDAATPEVRILSRFAQNQIRKPLIPLGSRGKFDQADYEVVGFQVRGNEEEQWEWNEYVLFNPFRGYLYLTEYQGHWNLVRPVRAIPGATTAYSKPARRWRGLVFRQFSHSTAKTIFVLGEFPWRVSVGEAATGDDFISPPYLLSAESTANETTWSEGEYLAGAEVWRTLRLAGSAPAAQGTYLNQPAPPSPSGMWSLCFLLELALAVLVLLTFVITRNEVVYEDSHVFQRSATGEPSYVTPAFDLKGRTSSVKVQTKTDLENQWMYFNYALINEATGHGYDFGREVGHYSGRDSDGSWEEGSRDDSFTIASVPAGRYYLRVEPEADPAVMSARYSVSVRRDTPSPAFFVIAALLLPLPAIFAAWGRARFEYRRWQESDLGSSEGSDEGDD